MSAEQPRALNIFAPAKINLFLHITGCLDNGYHTLDSLVSFVDIGDQILIKPATEFSFDIKGHFAKAFVADERLSGPDSSNLVVRAVWEYAKKAGREPNCSIVLNKNLPLASGIGGGSADAAATIWGLSQLWGLSKNISGPYMQDLLLSLGADVPVCLKSSPARMQGIGEILSPSPVHEEMHVVLVRPKKFCSTKEVFSRYNESSNNSYKEIVPIPDSIEGFDNVISFLLDQDNDLTPAAIELVPEIEIILDSLKSQDGCALSRMSGSGACCFGIFSSEDAASLATEEILYGNPEWWVRSATLNRTDRY
jgi:4-diphosphocytidyl-2-C-methyl-D-erythritol kinase